MEVTTPQASTIDRVVVLRAGSVTHAFNADQRYVGLNFTRHDGGLTVSFPENPDLLPPGPYLLFVLDATAAPEAGALAGIPSVGRHLRIDGRAAPAAPKVALQLNAASYHTGDTMTVVATVTPGGAASPVDGKSWFSSPTDSSSHCRSTGLRFRARYPCDQLRPGTGAAAGVAIHLHRRGTSRGVHVVCGVHGTRHDELRERAGAVALRLCALSLRALSPGHT